MREFSYLVLVGLLAIVQVNSLPQRPNVPRPQPPLVTKAKGQPQAPVVPPRASGNLTFVLSGSMLPTSDSNSKADAFVLVYSKTGSTPEKEVGRTDTLTNEDNPKWNNVFWLDWKKGTGQTLRFVVKDYDTLSRSDILGEVTVNADEYVEKNQNLKVALVNPKDSPKIKGGFLTLTRVQPTRFLLYGRQIPAKDPFGGKSDVYADVFWRKGKAGVDVPLGTTETIDDSDNPDWKKIFEFANYQPGQDQYWHIIVYDKDNLSSDTIGDLLIEVEPFVKKRSTSLVKLKNADNKATIGITPY